MINVIELTDTRYEWIGPTGVRFVQTPSPRGVWYHEATPARVRAALDTAFFNGNRVRLFLGEPETGRSWHEEFDTIGRIGRSSGRVAVPILLPLRTSRGGSAVLDRCIVGIQSAPGRWTLKHPGLDLGAWAVGPASSEGYCAAALCDGKTVAQFRKPGQAERYCAFMRGERWSK